MLLERAAGLASKIGQYGKLKAAANEAELFRTRATQLGEAAALLTQARVALDRFRAAGVPVDFHPVNATELSERVETLRDLARDNPAALADPPFNLRHLFTDRLRHLAVAANGAVSDAWRAYVAANGPAAHNDILNALGELPQMRAGVNRIRGYRQQVTALAASLPPDPAAAVAQLKTLVAAHDAAWRELTADEVPPSVIHFLRAAVTGAPVSALTSEVRTWLDARNLLGSFKIRIG